MAWWRLDGAHAIGKSASGGRPTLSSGVAPCQIDNPCVDSPSNGFNYVVSKFREQPIAAHIELQKG